MSNIQQRIHSSLETRDSYEQAAREGAALRGELGINAQLIALSEVAKAERVQGNEAAYQAIKAEAYRLRAAYVAGESDSEQAIPTGAAILVVVAERLADATRQHDDITVRRLERVAKNIKAGARMRWAMGDLLISSVTTPGATYTLSCGACNCPARKPCWHCELLDILLVMQDTAAGDADYEADLAEMETDERWLPVLVEQRAADDSARAEHGRRLCAARSRVMQEAA